MQMAQSPDIGISIVSHGQGALVKTLLSDLKGCRSLPVEVLLTVNVMEDLPFDPTDFDFPIRIIANAAPKGFAANHNAAFRLTKADYFCILNPDIRLERDPFPCLLQELKHPAVGAAGPLIVDPSGRIEDSARRFPTPVGILKKALFGTGNPEYAIGEATIYPEWIAGMFMVFDSAVYRSIGGLDERYFLYYEDVDLCWRLQRCGYRVALVPAVRAIHDARRKSHRNLRYLTWHAASMLRFFARRAVSSLAG
ncbi:MAG TPA: glycosyltransferase family 2 protein [Burkholderiales bacterium]|nr:glycosyltransferase family 2 protein [Burkholderiales bacterium]